MLTATEHPRQEPAQTYSLGHFYFYFIKAFRIACRIGSSVPGRVISAEPLSPANCEVTLTPNSGAIGLISFNEGRSMLNAPSLPLKSGDSSFC